MSLYTKYRPRDWDSVIGQDMIATILRNSLKNDRVGHAYILTGSRGTGKTTSARILAKGVNCLHLRDGNPCHECANCVAFDSGSFLDVIEIDGASNNGVENVRELIEKARFEPSQGTYKVYIIDEVHMLSTGAFNALLKTLEEPPKHVKFILATTEIEKVPETIRSRSLRFDFKKITPGDIVKRLEFVTESEGIKAEKEALAIIAKAARGALRDALTLTEQNTINHEISTEYVRSTLSLLEENLIEQILISIKNEDQKSIIDIIEILRERHIDARGFLDQMLYATRDKLIEHMDDSEFGIYESIFSIFENAYTKVRSIPDGFLLIEMTLIRAVKRMNNEQGTMNNIRIAKAQNNESQKEGNSTKENTKAKDEIKIPEKKDEISKMEVQEENRMKAQNENGGKDYNSLPGFGGGNLSKNSSTQNNIGEEFSSGEEISNTAEQSEKGASFSSPNSFGTFSTKSTEKTIGKAEQQSTENPEIAKEVPFSYPKLLQITKEKRPALVTDLKLARFKCDNTTLTLIFSKKWNYDRVNTPATQGILTEILAETFGGIWSLSCILEEGVGANIVDEVF